MKFDSKKKGMSAKGMKQRGVSIINVVIILAIGGLLAFVAIVFGLRYIDQTKTQNELSAITDLKANVVSYGSRAGVFTTANSSLPVLVGQRIFPAGVITGTAAAPVISNAWGGTVTVDLVTINIEGDSLVFTSSGIPAASCATLATSLDNIASRILVGTTQTKAVGASTVAATVNTACAAGVDNNTLVMTMAR